MLADHYVIWVTHSLVDCCYDTRQKNKRTCLEVKRIVSFDIQRIKWSERKMQWVAPSGARLWMSYLDRDDDVLRYQGLAFSWIGFDELTQWATPFAWNYMRSRLRSTAPDLPVYMRATTNPGGRVISGLKKCLLTLHLMEKHSMPQTLKQDKFSNTLMGMVKQEKPYLKEDSSLLGYLITHLSSREITKRCFYPSCYQRKQLLEGDWDIKEGAAFTEFNRILTLLSLFQFRIWVKFRSCDYGYGSYSAVLWFAVSRDEQLVVYRELYVSKVLATDLADVILELEADDGNISMVFWIALFGTNVVILVLLLLNR